MVAVAASSTLRERSIGSVCVSDCWSWLGEAVLAGGWDREATGSLWEDCPSDESGRQSRFDFLQVGQTQSRELIVGHSDKISYDIRRSEVAKLTVLRVASAL